jgi:hypothetical protein
MNALCWKFFRTWVRLPPPPPFLFSSEGFVEASRHISIRNMRQELGRKAPYRLSLGLGSQMMIFVMDIETFAI